ncbi:MAG: alanine--tRNA ligase [Myxococcales bacterium]|nr:alanine--tRNA ligase [Myxococcales bacterium]
MVNKTWNSSEVRELFLSFFEESAHLRIPSAGLVPKNDPTLLYINSGMAPLKDYFTAAAKPPQKTLVNVQTCIRTRDIDDVGDRHHLTLFEMMGQWSIGDYFKEKACQLSVELLVNGYGFDQSKLFVTCYGGDEAQGIPRDTESYDAWRSLGFPEERVVYLGADNFWGPAGESGPCGPCTEVFYDTGDNYGPAYVPGGDFDSSSRYIEIWNAGVFMQYDKRASGKLDSLPFNSVDTGSGLERMTMILNGMDTVYETDLMKPHMDGISERLGEASTVRDCRMITDHLRAATFILAEGVRPGNDGRNYIPRRLLRKCIAVTTRAGLPEFDYDGLIHGIVDQMEPFYPHLGQGRQTILKSFNAERVEFERTLSRGLDKLEGLSKGEKPQISGQDAFDLFQSYGLPFDIIRDVVEEKGGSTDEAGYDAAFARHQKISKGNTKESSGEKSPWPQDDAPYRNLDDDAADSEFVGYESMEGQGRVQVLLVKGEAVEKAEEGTFVEVIATSTPFYAESGGQAGDQGGIKAPFGQLEVLDCQKVVGRFRVHRCRVESGCVSVGDMLTLSVDESIRRDSMNNHSATHVMHAVLRDVLGEHVKQAGSQVDAERLRFDFDHPQRVSPEELSEIERRVNLHIRQNVERLTLETSYDDAVSKGALAFFGDTYGELVRMVKFGDVSTELCGGTHVGRTGDIGSFRIISEGSVASGVRRIVAVSGRGAMEFTMEQGQLLNTIALKLKTKVADIPERLEALTAKKAKPKKAAPAADLSEQAKTAESGTKYVVARLFGEAADMREEALRLADKISGVVALIGEEEGKVRMVIAVAKPLTKEINAGALFKKVAPLIDGRGGGKPHLAQGGGQNPAGIEKLISEFPNVL